MATATVARVQAECTTACLLSAAKTLTGVAPRKNPLPLTFTSVPPAYEPCNGVNDDTAKATATAGIGEVASTSTSSGAA